MQGQRGFWDVEDRLKELSAEGDPLERLAQTVDFELFRPALGEALGRSDPSKGGRPGFDPVLKFKMLVLGAMHGLSLQQTDYLVRDRLSWMRFCGLGAGDTVPDANTLWDFREALIAAEALDDLFARLDRAITDAGYLPMAGQIVDATLVAAPRQRNSDGEKAEIKAGRIPKGWKDKPAKLRQKDRDARWTVKFSKAKTDENGKVQQRDIAVPHFGDKNHISIDRRHGIIRCQKVTDAAAYDGARLREGLIDLSNTASYVWADTAYRSIANEAYLQRHGKVSRLQGRARLRPSEGPHGLVRENDRPCPRHGDHHSGQHGLQHAAMVLAQCSASHRITHAAQKSQYAELQSSQAPPQVNVETSIKPSHDQE